MTKTIFISHSADDLAINQFFRDAFDDTYVKPVMMENEKWSRKEEPNWKWIRKEIKKSTALFVILTKSVVSKVQTQNWIAFEIGVAATAIPQKPVYVFREEEVNFPVPYLNHYFPTRISVPKSPPGIIESFSKMLAADKSKQFLQGLIKSPQLTYEGKMYQCFTCRTAFSYWGEKSSFRCPCCNSLIMGGLHKPGLKKCNSCNTPNLHTVKNCIKCGNNTFRQTWE